ncbi:MAG: hypothetical protein DLM60_13915 [Pseudonocardiales bacterium]|nr:MAG: hypothetical protein DLM60_13915 [Pseudonocardiales bacterium]
MASLARQVVHYAAPDELPFFKATCDAFFAAPKLARRGHRDEPLGFGLETAFTVISTLALTVTVDVFKQLTEEHIRRMIDKTAPTFRLAALSKLFHRPPEQSADPLPHLHQDQITKIRELAYRRARQLQASEEQATLIADGIAKALASQFTMED